MNRHETTICTSKQQAVGTLGLITSSGLQRPITTWDVHVSESSSGDRSLDRVDKCLVKGQTIPALIRDHCPVSPLYMELESRLPETTPQNPPSQAQPPPGTETAPRLVPGSRSPIVPEERA
ncbi:hypothetical protein FDECE_10048 [Fusarium decemcellulare]|nr:hypothetical protein FDECE_10048 [Fusarium decemcellulare]